MVKLTTKKSNKHNLSLQKNIQSLCDVILMKLSSCRRLKWNPNDSEDVSFSILREIYIKYINVRQHVKAKW